ncbi:kinase-like protein [Sparassis crispa]|uniref:non-specific serine/threonine protein kinase n=1 Tax=Sparassis crispa TaxID=139825 RepID=A0A401GVI1_9APHY|nr:kinase-like protein [Sparassis crispa]GBE86225.1 kinase-like protein [Sparassis crispa]
MSTTWHRRKTRLGILLDADGDEDAESLALDRILHGQSVIGKTSKTTEIDTLRFSDEDLDVVGTLEYGQFGIIDVVTCKLNGDVYVRKSIEKRFALKTTDQCSPQLERDILLRARKTDSEWAPHLLCAFQTPTHLSIVMDYASGGTLWDVLQSSPHDGKVLETDLKWWAPQIISAIHWCHSQHFAHRDIKPHNFVLSTDSQLLLIDFGSAAPLLPPESDGSQRVPKRHCLVPCGTCDYISPEILQAHEEALVALEMADDSSAVPQDNTQGYGRETDWWSTGAMLYEMTHGIAPFFANDIRRTYLKITEHYKSLRFDRSMAISANLEDLLRGLLTTAELRLGRRSVEEIKEHPFFRSTDWSNLHRSPRPVDLHLPQFTYTTPIVPSAPVANSHSSSEGSSSSRPFAFSALFQSSPASTHGVSVLPVTPSHTSSRSILKEQPVASFIGFSWGPSLDAFTGAADQPNSNNQEGLSTIQPLNFLSVPPTHFASVPQTMHATPVMQRYPFATPVRPNVLTPFRTLPRASTVRRTAPRRAVSDREAMKQLVDCVGMSARKKVLESGRKPRIIGSSGRSSAVKELRFDSSVAVVGDSGVSYKVDPPTQSTVTLPSVLSLSGSGSQEALVDLPSYSDIDSDLPASPSPSPRPGSALSMMSRRSQTPTTSSFNLLRFGQDSMRVGEEEKLLVSSSVADSLSYDVLDEYDKRYTVLLEDLAGIESRLSRLSMVVRQHSC